jgi:hypothetical protein
MEFNNNNFIDINNMLDEIIDDKRQEVKITNIIPKVFCDHYGVDINDEYDLEHPCEVTLYGNFTYNNRNFGIYSTLYEGTVDISLN